MYEEKNNFYNLLYVWVKIIKNFKKFNGLKM